MAGAIETDSAPEPSPPEWSPLSRLTIDALQAVVNAIADGAMIVDAHDAVLVMNQTFTEITGYSMDDAPLTPPYPWWPTDDRELPAHQLLTGAVLDDRDGLEHDLVIYRRDGRRLTVRASGAALRDEEDHPLARLRIIRDVTKDRAALERRQTAAETSRHFSGADDLLQLMYAAQEGLALLFDGDPILLLDTGRQKVAFADGGYLGVAELESEDLAALEGSISGDTQNRRAGVLLTSAHDSDSRLRAWVRFPHPRRMGADELVVADLIAESLNSAALRILQADALAGRLAQLEQAIVTHRAVGQAVGILVERHRVLPEEAFARLKRASQDNNVKMRDLADRMLETGEEPEAL